MSWLLRILSALSLYLIVLIGLLLALYLFSNAGERNWWIFLSTMPTALGAKGGIVSVLANTLWIVASAMLISSLAAATATLLVLQFECQYTKTAKLIRILIEVGASTPRLLWGIGGAALFGHGLGLGLSAICGVLSLSCILAPLLASGFISALEQQQIRFMPTCLVLGFEKKQAWFEFLAPAAAPSILAVLIQAIGRGLGDAAALLLTAGAALYWLEAPGRPAATLAVYAYTVALDITDGLPNAYAASAVLLVLTAIIQAPLVHLQQR